jgi:hypothetical protein
MIEMNFLEVVIAAMAGEESNAVARRQFQIGETSLPSASCGISKHHREHIDSDMVTFWMPESRCDQKSPVATS